MNTPRAPRSVGARLGSIVHRAQELGISTHARRLLWRVGYDLRPALSGLDGQRLRLLETLGITTLVDVGANDGAWALQQRRLGFTGRIISIEPDPRCLVPLRERAARDGSWTVHAAAAGAERGSATLHRHESSLLNSLHAESDAAGTTVADAIEVEVRALDELLGDPAALGGAYLKIDTQGHELDVLRGCPRLLAAARGVEVEFAVRDYYEGAPSRVALEELLLDAGLALASIQTERFLDGRPIDMDAIYIRA